MNPETGLDGLKEFQQKTVEYAFRRMYLDPDYTRRFLVADETGLGKTHVARGIIEKTIEYLKEEGCKRNDVIYICSNGSIADQNLEKLRPAGEDVYTCATRLTLLPRELNNLKKEGTNLFSFTNRTGFKVGNDLGRVDERIDLWWLVDSIWGCKGAATYNIFQGRKKDPKEFRKDVKAAKFRIKPNIRRAFAKAVKGKRVNSEYAPGVSTLKELYDDLCTRFKRFRKWSDISWKDYYACKLFVGSLRAVLAKSALQVLKPRLVILDEFQRFRELLDGTQADEFTEEPDDAKILARELFAYSDSEAEARVLLLSATPYKMYTLQHEMGAAGDDHYRDFLKTYSFLVSDDEEKTRELKGEIDAYGESMRDIKALDESTRSLLEKGKKGIEEKLQGVMARTERLPVSRNLSGMFEEVRDNEPVLSARDVRVYHDLQKLAKWLGHPQVTEYWKSAPFLLNFMTGYKGYKFKKQFEKMKNRIAMAREIRFSEDLFLSRKAIEGYRELEPGNAKIRSLVEDIRESGAGEVLWLPPSCPYYGLSKAFEKVSQAGFTKRLIFSSWRIVPKSIAMLLSYEVERLAFQKDEKRPRNTLEARKKRRGLLAFKGGKGGRGSMSHLALYYPSFTLAEIGDPLRYREKGEALPSLREIRKRVSSELAPLLKKLTAEAAKSGKVDERWYWAAPILLDNELSQEASDIWWSGDEPDEYWADECGAWYLADAWMGEGLKDNEGGGNWAEDIRQESIWGEHVVYAKKLADGKIKLGRPPRDLLQILALMALGAPAVTALRAISRSAGPESLRDYETRCSAGQISMSFRSYFNRKEAMAILGRISRKRRGAYWRRVLEYCAAGCLSSVLDEYAHLVGESQKSREDTEDESRGAKIGKILHGEIESALGLRVASPAYDEIEIKDGRVRIPRKKPSMRGHFAQEYAADRREEDSKRSEKVKDAFMSPFWPFVLATTSVGQEGLDFHWYCHSVVHWNLPSNPVDLEQREGRVDRYKGHAIRKNIAKKYGTVLDGKTKGDPWEEMFDAAEKGARSKDRGLVPYWIFEDEGIENPSKIERRVPNLPLSRDKNKLEALKRSLVLYRMVFGQPRQEDLLEYLQKNIGVEELEQSKDLFRMNLEPPRVAKK